ncbi:bifunctional Ribosome-binding factor A domain superfamily/K homology domain-like [Babesia duncani]|uniref:Bifunctional Ribosome-binding factor A domain superfamily/K homology domain-like n=1 Tax=Babesia duncani TaxID=323732 RepID=A0AAD9PK46_9APIC|nr:bifunctional Ribosome-binding factor A domain superfamily/K homology domain-like [Babesia duncani]
MLYVSHILRFSKHGAFVRRRISQGLVEQELNALKEEYLNSKHIGKNDSPHEIESRELDSVFQDLNGRYGYPQRSHGRKNNQKPFNPTKSRNDARLKLGKYDFDILPEEEDTFESLKKFSRYQDLTHQERSEIQELQLDSRLRDPEDLLNRHKAKVNVKHEAKRLLLNDEKVDCEFAEKNRFDELASRLRQKIREEKLESSRIAKSPIPNCNGVIVDPIKRHVQRRAQRISAMLKEHIQQFLSCNDPEFLYEHLKGASISLVRVEMPTSKSTVLCHYTCKFNAGLSDSELQKRLDLIAPKMRFLLARKLELGYTPPVKFVKELPVNSLDKSSVLPFNLPLETTLKNTMVAFHKERGGF